MFGKLLLIFIVLPLAEVALLSFLSNWIGWPLLLLLLIGTGLTGAWLAKRQGWEVLRRLRSDAADGRLPADSLLDGALIFLAAVLLITPGLITDVCGVCLLVPRVRRYCHGRIVRWIRERLKVTMVSGPVHSPVSGNGPIVDSYVVDRSEPAGEIEEKGRHGEGENEKE